MFKDPFAPKRRSKKQPSIFDFGGVGIQSNSKPKRDIRRSFTKTQKDAIWAQQGGRCAKCHQTLDPRYVEYDHKKGWADGGRTVVVNGQALCANCHKIKTHKSRLKKVNSRSGTQKAEENSLFNFSGGLFGSSQGKRKKPKGPFDFGF